MHNLNGALCHLEKNIKMCQTFSEICEMKGPGIPLHFIQHVKRKIIQFFSQKKKLDVKK